MGCGHAERGGNSGGNSENQTEPFTIEINRLHPQFNRARLHQKFPSGPNLQPDSNAVLEDGLQRNPAALFARKRSSRAVRGQSDGMGISMKARNGPATWIRKYGRVSERRLRAVRGGNSWGNSRNRTKPFAKETNPLPAQFNGARLFRCVRSVNPRTHQSLSTLST